MDNDEVMKLDKDFAVFKEVIGNKVDKINTELSWISRITLFQLLCLVLLLGGDKGLALLSALKVIP